MLGLVVGALLGAVLLAVGRSAAGPTIAPANNDAGTPEVDVLHRSPILVDPGEAVSLDYELVCASTDPYAVCGAAGDVFVKPAGTSAYTRIPLERSLDGHLHAAVPRALARTGFAYYAQIRETVSGVSRTLPPGGAEAPHRVWVMTNRVTVDLRSHRFGHTRTPEATVVRAGWGSGRADAGLNAGAEQARMGPGAFDVASDGSVVMLDQVNGRVTTFAPDGSVRRQVAVLFTGGMGDLALAPDGRMVIVEDGGPGSPTPVIRLVGADGAQIAATSLAERTAGLVRWSPAGAVVQQTPSDTWMRATDGSAGVLDAAAQVRSSRVGRLIDTAQIASLVDEQQVELVVDGTMYDTRYALVSGERLLQSWRVRSGTPLGEVQLFEPYRGGLLVVQRVWTDGAAEFQVLHLGPLGIRQRFTVDAAEWAESSPHSRFRYANGSLYQLRSSADGVEVARFSLGGGTR
jgi:hypothetical protein